jgi:hypothetical protein
MNTHRAVQHWGQQSAAHIISAGRFLITARETEMDVDSEVGQKKNEREASQTSFCQD